MRLVLQLVGAALFFLSAIATAWAAPHNITQVLVGHPDYSVLAFYLVKTGVAYEIDSRSSITVLAPSNKLLLPVVQQHPVSAVADILRYHVLLQYFDNAQLHSSSAAATTVTTLYQTTGRAAGDGGIVDVALEADGSVSVGQRGQQAPKTARIQASISANPYNLSVFDVSEVLLPPGLSEGLDSSSVNLTDVLVRAGSFNTVVSLLQASHLDQELQSKISSSGLTLLLPNDTVFSRTFTPAQIDRLSADQKTALLKYHALPAYYPLDYFKLISSTTVLTTLATSSPAQADYLLSVSPTSSNGKVFIGTGIVSAGLGDRAVYQDYPAAIFSVDNVLLPKEIFASFPSAPAAAPDTASAAPPSVAVAPVPALPDTSAPVPAPASFPPPPPPSLSPSPSPAAEAATAPSTPPASSPKTSPSSAPHHSAAAGPGPHSGPSRGGASSGPSEAEQSAAAGHFSVVAAMVVSSFVCATSWLFFL